MSLAPETQRAILEAVARGVETYAEIARRLGVTKNVVAGVAFRARRGAAGSPARPARGGGAAGRSRRRAALRIAGSSLPEAATAAATSAAATPLAPRRPLLPNQFGLPPACQWIEARPAGAATRFCGAPRAAHSPAYCEAHHARCFVVAAR